MADQRQPFRFRLPWLSAGAAAPPPRPAVESQPPRPAVRTQPPTQPTTTTLTQRPPFRPAGIAPTPAQVQAPPRPEPQPPSPPRPANGSQVTSQPVLPSRATTQTQGGSVLASPLREAAKSQVNLQPASPSRSTSQTQPTSSLPPSPSRAAVQSRGSSVPPSPSRTAAKTEPALQPTPQPQFQTGQTSSQPSSPSLSTIQVQPTSGAVFQPSSPSKKLQPIDQKSSQPQPPSSSSKQEPKPPVSQALSQEPQPNAEIKSKIVPNAQNQTMLPNEPSQALGTVAVAVLSSVEAPETFAQTKKLDSKTIGASPKPLSESETKMEGPEERDKGVKGPTKEERTNGSPSEESIQKAITELLTAATGPGRQTTDLHIAVPFKTELEEQEKHENVERKNAVITSSSNGKQIKFVSAAHPNDRHNVNESQQKPLMYNREQAPLHKEIREDISKFYHKLASGNPKQTLQEKAVSVITLAGENRGASMQIGSQSAKKEESVHIRRGYKLNPDESTEATTDGEGSSKGRRSNDPVTKEDSATRAYINSNVQSFNNSIVFSSSVNERNPGVQLLLSHNIAEPIKSDTKPESLETRKAEFNVTPAQKLTYEPTIRRRCLRGLFMEPSDSDPDDPEKPRRHGCRYNCRDMSKDKEIGVL